MAARAYLAPTPAGCWPGVVVSLAAHTIAGTAITYTVTRAVMGEAADGEPGNLDSAKRGKTA